MNQSHTHKEGLILPYRGLASSFKGLMKQAASMTMAMQYIQTT
jgi:hypothetical protein